MAADLSCRGGDDPWTSFETLLYGYLESAEADAGLRYALLGPGEPRWTDITAEKTDFSTITERIVRRAVEAGRLREDFDAQDFVLITRGAMATVTGADDWRRHVALFLDGIRYREP
ncbi:MULTISPECIES: hypothetical protein [Streptomyces]|uniref:SbtR family transcriptional regulator n=1 Tax=Streptomyces TaxID=1883 RepID=UPI002FDC3D53